MREREQSEIQFLAFAPPDNEDLDPVDEMNDLQDGVLGYEIDEERSMDNEIQEEDEMDESVDSAMMDAYDQQISNEELKYLVEKIHGFAKW